MGITSIGILSGIVGESALARPMEAFLVMVGLSPETAKAIGLFVVVVLITYFSIVMGELVPKRIGQISPEPVVSRLLFTVFPLLPLLLSNSCRPRRTCF